MIHALRMNDCLQKQRLRYTSIRARHTEVWSLFPFPSPCSFLQFSLSLSFAGISTRPFTDFGCCMLVRCTFLCNAHVLIGRRCGLLHQVMRRLLFAGFFSGIFWMFCYCFCPVFFSPYAIRSLSSTLFFTPFLSISPFLIFRSHLAHASFLALFQNSSKLGTQTSFHFNIFGSRIP